MTSSSIFSDFQAEVGTELAWPGSSFQGEKCMLAGISNSWWWFEVPTGRVMWEWLLVKSSKEIGPLVIFGSRARGPEHWLTG